ncbi:hypothetical protein [Cellulomonas sp. PhB150]|uniref:hypothetical protein n=1 Tax=Cellulomonas sp. PhB150 TaxID=2485188 RepID=UPI000F48549E|nr:hypothetical protein [Cellulomonas sp. PhB150]ROS25764.1 hypothetical protein EDF34_2085 [Cellulomonas sp. PhB150]
MGTRLLLEGTDLAALMAHVREELGAGAKVVRAERVRTGGVAGFFAREHFELTVEVPEPVAPRPRASRVDAGLEDLLDAADASDSAASADDGRPEVSTGGPAFADVLEQVRALVGESRTEPRPAPPEVLRAAPDEPPTDLADRLTTLGVPPRLLVDRPRTLSQALAAVPVAADPDRSPGSVLAVVGAAGDVDAVATLLAERLHLDAAAVVPAGTPTARPAVPRPRSGAGRVRPTGPDEAARWREVAARAPHPWVVALAVAPDADERSTAAEILRVLGPDQAWAVVDARTKTVDARAWMASLGVFDAVAVRGAFDTTEPGSVLDLGVPVAWLDGIPASTAAWAALLDRALGGLGRWD